jgi:hypothetical protein
MILRERGGGRPTWSGNAHPMSDVLCTRSDSSVALCFGWIGQIVPASVGWQRAYRKACRLPGTEAAIEVGGVVDAEILQRSRGKARSVALVAHENDMQIVCGKRQTVRTGRVETPLQHGAFDDKGAGELTFIGAIGLGPDVHEGRSVTLGFEGLVRSETDESAARFLQELVDASPARMNHRYPLVVRVI